MEKYYYDDKTHIDVLKIYKTIWSGYLKKSSESKNWFTKEDLKRIDDIIVEICDQNLYTALDDDYLYISMDQDDKYYYYDFEKQIFILIKRLEKDFDLIICEGQFHANELKPFGNQYRYNIDRTNKKINLKKHVLNWGNYDKLKKKTNK